MMVRVRCRQCGWDSEIPRVRIPRYGARIRCPECGGLQTVRPVQAAVRPAAAREVAAAVWEPPTLHRGGLPAPGTPGPAAPRPGDSAGAVQGAAREIADSTDPAALRTEARDLLRLWLQELRRAGPRPLTPRTLVRDHADELAHLFSLWQASHPGERAATLFREELMATVDPDPLVHATGASRALTRPTGPAAAKQEDHRA